MSVRTLKKKSGVIILRKLTRNFICKFVINLLIVFAIMIVELTMQVKENTQRQIETIMNAEHESIAETATHETKEKTTAVVFSRNLSEEEKYLLAKIAMAEAEGESFETKMLVIETVLNRVKSKSFPNTVKEVIFEKDNGVYQFSPMMPGGRWWKVEPNEECWKAVNTVNATKRDISDGALFFEACQGESWHSRNLKLIRKVDKTSFYK